MDLNMSQPFVDSFLETCFDAGINEQEASRLLQKQSVDAKRGNSPAFAAGYDSTMTENLEAFSKEASKGQVGKGVAEAGRHAWDAVKALGRSGREAGRDVGRGVGRVANPSNPRSFISKHPGVSALATAGAGVAGTYGVNKMLNGGLPWENDLRLNPGAFSPEAYDTQFEGAMDTRFGPDIFAHNKALRENQKALDELRAAEASNSLTGVDYKRMRDLERQQAVARLRQRDHFTGLDRIHNESTALMDEIAKKTQSLEKSRQGGLGGIWHRLRALTSGQNSGDYFDNQIASLKDRARNAQMQADLAAERRQLLASGAESRSTTEIPSSQEIQQRFFTPDTYE